MRDRFVPIGIRQTHKVDAGYSLGIVTSLPSYFSVCYANLRRGVRVKAEGDWISRSFFGSPTSRPRDRTVASIRREARLSSPDEGM